MAAGSSVSPLSSFFFATGRISASLFLSSRWHLPPDKDIDAKLVIGAAIFGVGWGLSGYCPGPALAGLALSYWQTAVVAGTMGLGAIVARRFWP